MSERNLASAECGRPVKCAGENAMVEHPGTQLLQTRLAAQFPYMERIRRTRHRTFVILLQQLTLVVTH